MVKWYDQVQPNTGFVTVMAESSAGKEQRNGVGNVIALTFSCDRQYH